MPMLIVLVFDFLIMTLGIIFYKKIIKIFMITLIILTVGLIQLFCTKYLIENKKMKMLPDDYIMGGMKYATILPLFIELTN